MNTPFGSVRRLCEAGNRVVFEGSDGECFLENVKTGFKVPIVMRRGMYWIDTYVKKDGSKPEDGAREMASIVEVMKEDAKSGF